MHATGNHVERLTNLQRLQLTAVIIIILALPVSLLGLALYARGHRTPAAPGPAPITVQPIPADVPNGPLVSA